MLLIHTELSTLYKTGCYLPIFTSAMSQLAAPKPVAQRNIFHCGVVPVDRCCLPLIATVKNKWQRTFLYLPLLRFRPVTTFYLSLNILSELVLTVKRGGVLKMESQARRTSTDQFTCYWRYGGMGWVIRLMTSARHRPGFLAFSVYTGHQKKCPGIVKH